MEQRPNQMTMNINQKDIIDGETIVCSSCGYKFFKQACVLKKVPGFMLGLGQDTVIMPIQVLVCNACGELAPSIKEDKMMENLLEGKKQVETKSGLLINT